MDPNCPIEVTELVKALNSISRQYHEIAASSELEAERNSRLLVRSISHGSIVIDFVTDYLPHITTIAGLAGVLHQFEIVDKLGERLKWLVEKFRTRPKKSHLADISVTDCDDAINFLQPIANNGGSQTVTIVKNNIETAIFVTSSDQARAFSNNAKMIRSELVGSISETKQRVPLIWKQIHKDAIKSAGTSPDKGVIEEIDQKVHPILFADDMASLKRQMVSDDDNPLQKIYFVDVEVSRVQGKVVSYRVVGYHGKEELG